MVWLFEGFYFDEGDGGWFGVGEEDAQFGSFYGAERDGVFTVCQRFFWRRMCVGDICPIIILPTLDGIFFWSFEFRVVGVEIKLHGAELFFAAEIEAEPIFGGGRLFVRPEVLDVRVKPDASIHGLIEFVGGIDGSRWRGETFARHVHG